jgi:hypothetical protein
MRTSLPVGFSSAVAIAIEAALDLAQRVQTFLGACGDRCFAEE